MVRVTAKSINQTNNNNNNNNNNKYHKLSRTTASIILNFSGLVLGQLFYVFCSSRGGYLVVALLLHCLYFFFTALEVSYLRFLQPHGVSYLIIFVTSVHQLMS